MACCEVGKRSVSYCGAVWGLTPPRDLTLLGGWLYVGSAPRSASYARLPMALWEDGKSWEFVGIVKIEMGKLRGE